MREASPILAGSLAWANGRATFAHYDAHEHVLEMEPVSGRLLTREAQMQGAIAILWQKLSEAQAQLAEARAQRDAAAAERDKAAADRDANAKSAAELQQKLDAVAPNEADQAAIKSAQEAGVLPK